MSAPKKARKGEHVHHYYVEPTWCVEALADHLVPQLKGSLFRRSSVVWDPACGSGTIPRVFEARGIKACGTDIVDRMAVNFVGKLNFLLMNSLPFALAEWEPNWIIANPPFKDLEAFARKAFTLPVRFIAFIVPLSWLASQTRHALFTNHPPVTVAILSQRPSMPPGDKVAELGSAAFKGGKTDYAWIIWDQHTRNPVTRMIWLPPRVIEVA